MKFKKFQNADAATNNVKIRKEDENIFFLFFR